MEFNKKGILARAKAATQESTVVMDEGLRIKNPFQLWSLNSRLKALFLRAKIPIKC